MQDNQTVDNQYHTRLKTNSNLIFFKKVTLFTEKYTEQLPYNVTPLIHNPERGLRVRNLPDRESVTCSVKNRRRKSSRSTVESPSERHPWAKEHQGRNPLDWLDMTCSAKW